MESDTKGFSHDTALRSTSGPPPGGPDPAKPEPEPRGDGLSAWTRPATARNEIRPAEPPPPPARRSDPLLPLGLIALSLVLALLAVAFALQT